jgi:hypothetical protein
MCPSRSPLKTSSMSSRAAVTLPMLVCAARTDVVTELPEVAMFGGPLHRLHRGPAHQLAALFGDPAAVDCGVGLVVLGVSPAQLASCAARRKRPISPISATNTAARIAPHPRNSLDRDIAQVPPETITNQRGEHLDFDAQAVDHPAG